MNTTEMAREVAARCNLSYTDAKRAVDATWQIIEDVLADHEPVDIRAFGHFELVDRVARRHHDIKSGGVVEIDARRIVWFVPSTTLKRTLNPE